MCTAFEYDLIIITPILSFQALLKQVGAAEVEGTDAGGGDHLEGDVDSEIVRIVSEAVTGLKTSTTAEAAADLPVEGTPRAGE
jgi:hypothetical protein